MTRDEMVAAVVATGDVDEGEAGLALEEAADATRYYARRGEWPRVMSERAWAAVRALPLMELSRVGR